MEFALSLSELGNLCRKYGAQVPAGLLPSGIDATRLLWAIAGKESSYGANCVPRHELAYCRGGKYFQGMQTVHSGCLWHCSFGPWQLMAADFIPGFWPEHVMLDFDILAMLSTKFLIRLCTSRGPGTLAQIAMAWNEGNFYLDRIETDPYTLDVVKLYDEPTLRIPEGN